jgi:hypothetical protein
MARVPKTRLWDILRKRASSVDSNCFPSVHCCVQNIHSFTRHLRADATSVDTMVSHLVLLGRVGDAVSSKLWDRCVRFGALDSRDRRCSAYAVYEDAAIGHQNDEQQRDADDRHSDAYQYPQWYHFAFGIAVNVGSFVVDVEVPSSNSGYDFAAVCESHSVSVYHGVN